MAQTGGVLQHTESVQDGKVQNRIRGRRQNKSCAPLTRQKWDVPSTASLEKKQWSPGHISPERPDQRFGAYDEYRGTDCVEVQSLAHRDIVES